MRKAWSAAVNSCPACCDRTFSSIPSVIHSVIKVAVSFSTGFTNKASIVFCVLIARYKSGAPDGRSEIELLKMDKKLESALE